jgi:hypothetical protein
VTLPVTSRRPVRHTNNTDACRVYRDRFETTNILRAEQFSRRAGLRLLTGRAVEWGDAEGFSAFGGTVPRTPVAVMAVTDCQLTKAENFGEAPMNEKLRSGVC